MCEKHTSSDNHNIARQVRDICHGKLVIVARHCLVRRFRSSLVKVVKVATNILEKIDSDDFCTCWPCTLIYIYY